MADNNKPLSRKDNLVVQELNGELLIYDLRSNKAFCLNETSALIWQACDGNKTVADISKQVGNEDLVWLALNDLKKQKLVSHEIATPAKFTGMSRREVVRNIGLSSVLAIPVIAGLVAPVAAQTGSLCGAPCPDTAFCMGSNCMSCSGNPMTCST